MLLIEFGSSRTKVYIDDQLQDYIALNLIDCSKDEMVTSIQALVEKYGVPNYSFFTEWARENPEIISVLKQYVNIGESRILTGLEEAEYFVKVVKKNFEIDATICDFGGGSVQISNSIDQIHSLKIGAIYIEKNIVKKGIPYDLSDLKIIEDYIDEKIYFLEVNSATNTNMIVGSTYVKSFFQAFFQDSLDGEYLRIDGLNGGIDRLLGKRYEDIVDIFPEPKGYMFGVLVLLVTIRKIAMKFNVERIYPTNLNWMHYFFMNE